MMADPVEELKHRHPVRAFIRRVGGDTVAAVVLVVATLAALIWANIGTSYQDLWGSMASITVAGRALELTLGDWVNDGLMALFFFGIGLDVRRELSIGDLRRPSQAALPIIGALGGIVVPAAIFLAINHSGPGAGAWGAVVSTDTAFALGMLALVGPKRGTRLRVFLMALAVVDDIGALTIIAFFYTDDLQVLWLVPVAVGLLIVWWMARRGVWHGFPYILVGIIVWLCTYFSGIHATLAGVLLALLLPVYPTRLDDVDTATRMSRLFRQSPRPESANRARHSISRAIPLNQRMSNLLEPYNNFLIVPLFALGNAGVALSGETLRAALTSPLTWGIIVGLVVGKFVGITGTSALVMKLRPQSQRPGLDLPRIAGVGGLGGMGFTISLLVIELAIDDEALADEARIGVLAASLLALLLGWAIFSLGNRFDPLPAPSGLTLPRDVDEENDHVLGSADSPAQLVVYADMGQIYRRQTAETLMEVRHVLGDELCLVYRHNVHDDDHLPVALVLESAADQGAFWQVHDSLVRRRQLPEPDEFGRMAEGMHLDVDELKHDVRTFAHLNRVERDSEDASDTGLGEEPAIFVAGDRLKGPASAANLIYQLRKAEKRGGSSQHQA